MKKSVLAIAVSAALMAGSAQAAIEVYGKLHLSLDQTDNGNTYNGNTNNAPATQVGGASNSGGPANAGTKAKSTYISTNASVLGFKASEDLEGGMKALGVIEVQIEADNPTKTAPFTEREVYAGLGGGFGTMRIGKIDTPMKLLGGVADLFRDQVGDNRNLTSKATGKGLVTNAPLASSTVPFTFNETQKPSWEVRASNALAYTTPDMGGFTISALYNPDEGRKNSSMKDIAARYAGDVGGGKLVVGLAWESHGKAWNYDQKAETAIRAAGSYTMGDAKAAVLYQKASHMNADPLNTSALTTSSTWVGKSDLDRTTWGLGGSYKIGAGAVKAQYYKAGETSSTAADGGTMIAIGYDHNLSKNTKVYIAYAATKNDDNGICTSGCGNTGSANGNKNNIPTSGGTFTAAGGGHDNNPNNVLAGQNGATPNNGSDPKSLSLGLVFSF